ncbi:MAG TPA: hypothetical protein VF510_01540 [Ktedonobacterales bacterium]
MSDQNYDQGGMGQGQMDNLRQQAEGRVDDAIDQSADKVPGGEQHAQQAKDAAASGLDRAQQEAENRMGDAGGLGDMLGGDKADQSNP